MLQWDGKRRSDRGAANAVARVTTTPVPQPERTLLSTTAAKETKSVAISTVDRGTFTSTVTAVTPDSAWKTA